MKCYNHHDRDAFGVCRSCGRALCLECMSNETENVVCANSLKCLYKDNQAEKMFKNADKVYSKENVRRSKWVAITFILVSLPFALFTILNFDIINLLFAISFASIGIVLFKRAKEIQT